MRSSRSQACMDVCSRDYVSVGLKKVRQNVLNPTSNHTLLSILWSLEDKVVINSFNFALNASLIQEAI